VLHSARCCSLSVMKKTSRLTVSSRKDGEPKCGGGEAAPVPTTAKIAPLTQNHLFSIDYHRSRISKMRVEGLCIVSMIFQNLVSFASQQMFGRAGPFKYTYLRTSRCTRPGG
jgi:hypothetical protein